MPLPCSGIFGCEYRKRCDAQFCGRIGNHTHNLFGLGGVNRALWYRVHYVVLAEPYGNLTGDATLSPCRPLTVRITTDGWEEPILDGSGRRIYLRNSARRMRVDLSTGPVLKAAEPIEVLERPYINIPGYSCGIGRPVPSPQVRVSEQDIGRIGDHRKLGCAASLERFRFTCWKKVTQIT